jgi:hypothetical protein
VGRARASIDVEARVSEAEALWYDLARWPAFVDGFAHVVKVEGDWPRAGARLIWTSVPDGRGSVVERVLRHEVRTGQTVEVEDERLTGEQSVTFTPAGDGAVRVDLELTWRLKQSHPLTPLVDLLFVRRAFGDALARTLTRFRRELRGDLELARTAPGQQGY